MKKILVIATICLAFGVMKADAQYVHARPGFSVGISLGAPGPAPYAGAVWVGPEWAWRNGHYVEVAGYWDRPYRHHRYWVPGHWRWTHWGYRWTPGHWR